MKVVIVKCDEDGNIGFKSILLKKRKICRSTKLHHGNLPSPAHGVFSKEHIREVCDIVHKFGGQV